MGNGGVEGERHTGWRKSKKMARDLWGGGPGQRMMKDESIVRLV